MAGAITFDIDPFRKHCLLNGLDDIGLTMEKAPHIDSFESKAAATRALGVTHGSMAATDPASHIARKVHGFLQALSLAGRRDRPRSRGRSRTHHRLVQCKEGIARFEIERGLVGGCAYDAHGKAISEDDMARAQAADAVIFGAVGGPKWDKVPYDVRPEAGLLRLRKDLGLFANLRPAICYPALADASSLKRDVVEGLDILIVRELTGGVYFGEPKTITDLGNGQKRAIDTQVYDTYEIERIARVAFDLARTRAQQGRLGRKAQCDEDGRLVERGRHPRSSRNHTRM